MLRGKDIPMHWTTVAKIEKGERSVRIEEAAAIADLLGISVDALLGRRGRPRSDERYALESLKNTVYQSSSLVSSIEKSLRERMDEARPFEFPERDMVMAACGRAADALANARDELSAVSFPSDGSAITPWAQRIVTRRLQEADDEA